MVKGTLDFLSKETNNKTKWNEFLTIKLSPLYKISDINYLILSPEFLIEKFFTSVYHDLIQLSITQNLPDFHSLYSKRFVEEYLLNKAIENIFGNSYAKYPESKMNELKPKKVNIGLPDYYIRNGNKVFIFECKNSYISHKLINQLDFTTLENDIKSKFYLNSKKKKKGIKQLLSFIQNSANGDYSFFDKNAKLNRLIYFPILIITDPLLRTIGFNQLLNEYFENDLKAIDNSLKERILPVTVIHIDDLLFYDKDLKRLDVLINDYFKFLSTKEYFEGMISFSDYLSTEKFPNYRKLNREQIEDYVKDSFLPE